MVLVVCAALLSVPLVSVASSAQSDTAVVTGPEGRTVLDLSRDRRYEIQGRAGQLELRVAGGAVACVAATCPDHVCVKSGTARPGRPIVCAPNGVSVSLSGSREGAFDALSR